jgi:hypothetical protein
MQFGPSFTGKGSTLQKNHPCAPATCKGNVVTMQAPRLPRAILAGTHTLQTVTRQQERSLRSAPGLGS